MIFAQALSLINCKLPSPTFELVTLEDVGVANAATPTGEARYADLAKPATDIALGRRAPTSPHGLIVRAPPDADPAEVVAEMIGGLIERAVDRAEQQRLWQGKCGAVARRFARLFPDSDPDVLIPAPPRGSELPARSFVAAQKERGVVKRGLSPVGLSRSLELAERHVDPEALKELGDLERYRSSIREPTTIKGVAPKYINKPGYLGGCGSKKMCVGNACEVRPYIEETWIKAVLARVNGGTCKKFDWKETTFDVYVGDGPLITGLRNWEIREPQRQSERLVVTGLEGAGKRYFHATSDMGQEIRRLTEIESEARASAVLSAAVARERSRNELTRDFEADADGADQGADSVSIKVPSTMRARRYAVDASARAFRA